MPTQQRCVGSLGDFNRACCTIEALHVMNALPCMLYSSLRQGTAALEIDSAAGPHALLVTVVNIVPPASGTRRAPL